MSEITGSMVELAGNVNRQDFRMTNPIIFNPVLPSYTTFNDKLDALTRGTESFLGNIWDWIVNLFKKIFGMSDSASSKSDKFTKEVKAKAEKMKETVMSEYSDLSKLRTAKFESKMSELFDADSPLRIPYSHVKDITAGLLASTKTLNAFGDQLRTQCEYVVTSLKPLCEALEREDKTKTNAIVDKLRLVLMPSRDLAVELIASVEKLGYAIEPSYPDSASPLHECIAAINCKPEPYETSESKSLSALGYSKKYFPADSPMHTALIRHCDTKKTIEFRTFEKDILPPMSVAKHANSDDVQLRAAYDWLRDSAKFIWARVSMRVTFDRCINKKVEMLTRVISVLDDVYKKAYLASVDDVVNPKQTKLDVKPTALARWLTQPNTAQAVCQFLLYQDPDRDITDNGLSCFASIGPSVIEPALKAVDDLERQMSLASNTNDAERFNDAVLSRVSIQMQKLCTTMSNVRWVSAQVEHSIRSESVVYAPEAMRAADRLGYDQPTAQIVESYIAHLKSARPEIAVTPDVGTWCQTFNAVDCSTNAFGSTPNVKMFFTEELPKVSLLRKLLQRELLLMVALSQHKLSISGVESLCPAQVRIAKSYNLYVKSLSEQTLASLEWVEAIQNMAIQLSDTIASSL